MKNMPDLLDTVRENNELINQRIQKIIEMRRTKRNSFEKDGKIDEDIRKIFEMETKKCLELYKLEFPNYRMQGKEGVSCRSGKSTADCFGGIDGLQITFGMQDFIDGIIMPTMKKIGYSIDENGLAYYSSNGNDYHEQNSKVKFPEKYVGSTRDQMDYFAYLFAKNGIDMDFVLDALPHEAMHTFGTTGGPTFLKEGITENLTREMCEKYGIHMTPTAHTQEAEFARKLEIIVGRDKIIQAGMWTGKFKEEHFKEILEKNPDISFRELSEIFEILKYEPRKLEADTDAKEHLEEFSKEHSEIVDILSQKVDLYRKQDVTERYSDVARAFSENLDLDPNSFFTYAMILEDFYALTLNHKTDPNFYRDLYTLDFEQMRDEYKFFDGKGLKDKDTEILDKIQNLCQGISQDNIGNFNDLMKVVDEHVKGKEVHLNDDPNIDYSSVLNLQQDEIGFLDGIIKRYEENDKVQSDTILPENALKNALLHTTSEECEQAHKVENMELENNKEGKEQE